MSEQEALRRRVYAVEFALWELHLFLDTHPNNSEAVRKQQEYKVRAAKLRKEYEEKYGPIGPTPREVSRWAWISDPWPWEADQQEQEGK